MSEVPGDAAQRAARLLRWYPHDWRSRYGEEFAELLIADLIERPHSRRRHADVAISGTIARLVATGLTGHPWAHQGLVPGGVAAFMWASTLWVSSYWAHPGGLALFPAAELAWMAVSPVAITFLVTGAMKIIRRVALPQGVLRFEAVLARAAALGMGAFLLGAGTWVVSGRPGSGSLFHVGTIDITAIIVMAAALAVAHRAIQRARYGGVALLER